MTEPVLVPLLVSDTTLTVLIIIGFFAAIYLFHRWGLRRFRRDLDEKFKD